MIDTIRESAGNILERYKPLRAESVYRDAGLETIQLDASEIFRALVQPIRLLLISSKKFDSQDPSDPQWFDKYLFENLQASSVVVIVLSTTSTVAIRAIKSSMLGPGHPICEADDLLSSSDTKEALRKVILPHASAYRGESSLSPYKIHVHAARNMFFNREDDLSKIRHSTGHMFIIGARRIGKTSLALRFMDHQEEIDRNSGPLDLSGLKMKRCAYIDVTKLAQPVSETLWGQILKGFGLEPRRYNIYARRVKISASRVSHATDEAQAVERIVAHFRGKLSIILDEVDGWIYREAADGWQTLDRLRAMTDQGEARLILVGYELLRMALSNDKFPFFDRGHTLPLSPLEREPTYHLVTQPLAEFNVTLEPQGQILDRIWQETSGMPHLVQDICSNLLNICITKNLQKMSMTDVTAAIRMSDSIKRYKRGVSRSDFPLAEAIAGITILASGGLEGGDDPKEEKSISNREIIEKLQECGYEYNAKEFEMALTYLELRLIIRPLDEEKTTWTWVNRAQRKGMEHHIANTGVKNWLDDLVTKHKQGDWRSRYGAVLGRRYN